MTNAEYVRSLSDRQIGALVAHLMDGGDGPNMCRNLPECIEAMDRLDLLPHNCRDCEELWAKAEYSGWPWIDLEEGEHG